MLTKGRQSMRWVLQPLGWSGTSARKSTASMIRNDVLLLAVRRWNISSSDASCISDAVTWRLVSIAMRLWSVQFLYGHLRRGNKTVRRLRCRRDVEPQDGRLDLCHICARAPPSRYCQQISGDFTAMVVKRSSSSSSYSASARAVRMEHFISLFEYSRWVVTEQSLTFNSTYFGDELCWVYLTPR